MKTKGIILVSLLVLIISVIVYFVISGNKTLLSSGTKTKTVTGPDGKTYVVPDNGNGTQTQSGVSSQNPFSVLSNLLGQGKNNQAPAAPDQFSIDQQSSTQAALSDLASGNSADVNAAGLTQEQIALWLV